MWLGREVGCECGSPDLDLLCVAWVEPRSVHLTQSCQRQLASGPAVGLPLMKNEVAPQWRLYCRMSSQAEGGHAEELSE